MPLIVQSSYQPPPLLRNAQLQTVLPTLFRRVRGFRYERERLTLPDGDFLDLDWSRKGSEKVVIICHGLESSSSEPYMRGMVRAFNRRGWDAVAVNFRSCSGEPNLRLRSYHSGATDDLDAVVRHILTAGKCRSLAVVGFSLGGNLVLKYIGENGSGLHPEIVASAAVSVPCDLESSADLLAENTNRFYMRRFIRKLNAKMVYKVKFPEAPFRLEDFDKVKDFRQFDDLYTGPVHGFKDAVDYWTHCSSRQFLPSIRRPTLLISAQDDPFLSDACYPGKEAQESEFFTLDAPEYGGHVGFISFNHGGEYWHETRVADFISEHALI